MHEWDVRRVGLDRKGEAKTISFCHAGTYTYP
jgi:hypothetical protein